uniref:Polysaccharide biosynthesis domain containing 1 n=1 Tax=Cyanoderma ruficeps TaxID=181631 RepID=A0A8C3R8X2_9PASS
MGGGTPREDICPQEVSQLSLLRVQPRVELAWAMKAHQHAQVYFNLISSVDPKFLKLTQVDDRIYEEFRGTFRDLRVDLLDPEELKSEPAKAKWRPFCLAFEGLVEDFNYGTLLRLDSRREYSEENTIFGEKRGPGGLRGDPRPTDPPWGADPCPCWFFQPPGSSSSPSRSPGTGKAATITSTGRQRPGRNSQDEDWELGKG